MYTFLAGQRRYRLFLWRRKAFNTGYFSIHSCVARLFGSWRREDVSAVEVRTDHINGTADGILTVIRPVHQGSGGPDLQRWRALGNTLEGLVFQLAHAGAHSSGSIVLSE